MNSVIVKTSAHVVTGLMLLFSVYLLLRGHNSPGGGFIAGLIAVIAFGLLMIAEGADYVRRRLVLNPLVFAGIGITVSLVAGVMALIDGKPFLTGLWFKAVPVGTPLIFDVGVFLVVLGSMLTILLRVEEELS